MQEWPTHIEDPDSPEWPEELHERFSLKLGPGEAWAGPLAIGRSEPMGLNFANRDTEASITEGKEDISMKRYDPTEPGQGDEQNEEAK